MKKLVNDPRSLVIESCRGFAQAHADVVRLQEDNLHLVRADSPVQGKVGLVSGGGSGHEPLHGGFVGRGMLDAAVPGEVFTSPTPEPVLAATRSVDGGAGVLHIVKNYTGDVLNFEMAAELAAEEDIEVRAVVVNDDVAVQDSLYTTGRRGVAGTVMVEKIAGAAAERGQSLAEVADVAQKVIDNVRSMGMALSACTVPHVGKPSFDLEDDEMEIGIGIHGEPGRHRKAVGTANEVTDQLLDPVVSDLGLADGDEVLLFVNGMGGTPLIEQYTVYNHARAQLEAKGVRVTRSLVGSYVTSLEMQGVSITVLKLDAQLTELWDDPVVTAAMVWGDARTVTA